MRYSIPEGVHFEEATPRGLMTEDFAAGEVELADDSDARFVIEHRLIPAGLATRVDAAPAAPAAPAAEVTPEAAPAADAPKE